MEPLFKLLKSIGINSEVSGYMMPCIAGFLEVQTAYINNERLNLALISRRAWNRCGIMQP